MCRRYMCGCRNHGAIILIKLTNFHPFYIMNLILSNQKTSRCVFKVLQKRRIAPRRLNARESARGDGKEGSLLPVPFPFNTERERETCRRENLGTRLKCSVQMGAKTCLRADVSYYLSCTQKREDVLFPSATLEIGYVCTQASPRPNFVDGIVTLSKWRWKIIWFAPLLSEGLLDYCLLVWEASEDMDCDLNWSACKESSVR